jgi:amidase
LDRKDPSDNYTLAQPFDTPPDYTQALNFHALRGVRIGIPRNAITPDRTGQPIVDAFEVAVQVLKNAGAIIVDNANYSAFEQFEADNNETTVLGADFVTDLAKYTSQLTFNPNNITDLESERNFTQTFKPEDYPDRDTSVWDDALALGFGNTDFRFWEAFQVTTFLGGEGGVTGALAAFNVTALILPTDFSPGQPAYAGLPVVTVPMGFYPANTTVITTSRNLVEIAPNVPYV